MMHVPIKSTTPMTKQTIHTINEMRVQGAKSSRDFLSINRGAHTNDTVRASNSAYANDTPHVNNTVPTNNTTHANNTVHANNTTARANNTMHANNTVHVNNTMYASNTSHVNNTVPTNNTTHANNTRNRQSYVASAVTSASTGQTKTTQTKPTQTKTTQTKPIKTRTMPLLKHTVQKGQKVLLASGNVPKIKVCLGWNTTNANCDVDVSAFLLHDNGKVIGDEWFVFYGQTESPDKSTHFQEESGVDCESITIDFTKLNQAVSKIVFVLTINEAMEKNLNFSMINDAYIRILQVDNQNQNGTELVSFKMDEYYANVTSMMIGEVYFYHGNWKFHAIGNGVARDLAGLCDLYGVQVI